MVDYNQLVTLSPDMVAYLQDESKRRGVSIYQVYQEEMEAEERARRGAFTQTELRELFENSQPNARLLEGDEECPF